MLRNERWKPLRHYLQNRFIHSQITLKDSLYHSIKDMKVLVLGIYLADRENQALHLMQRYGETRLLKITQRWAGLKGISDNDYVRKHTQIQNQELIPKIILLNQLLNTVDKEDYDFIIVSDDDITLPKGFMDAFIAKQFHYDFALAQPARAIHSFYDHKFCLRRPWLKARETLFVESGPVFSVARDAIKLLLPFDEASPMGWGCDLVWSSILQKNKLTMGIIDSISVDHSYRKQGTSYSKKINQEVMDAYLAQHPHLQWHELNTIVRSIYF